jgi:Helix-turn-helix domain
MRSIRGVVSTANTAPAVRTPRPAGREGPAMAVMQAYRFALDPTPRQARALASHCGAARFAFNWGLGLVKQRLDQRRADPADPGVSVP